MREYTAIVSVAVGGRLDIPYPSPALVGIGLDVDECDPAAWSELRHRLSFKVSDGRDQVAFVGMASALPTAKDLFVDVGPTRIEGERIYVHPHGASTPMMRVRLKLAVRP